MVPSVLRLDGVPARERFDFWWEAVAQSVVSVDVSSDQAADFWAEMRMLDLGVAQLSRVRCVSFDARRSPSRIRHSDPGHYQLSLTLRGRSGIQQEGREAGLAPTDITLYDTSRTFHAWTVAEEPGPGTPRGSRPSVADGLILQFPRDVLPLPASAAERLLAVRMSGKDGIGGLLSGYLHQLLAQPARRSPSDALRLSTVALDLVAALLAHELDTDVSDSLANPHGVLLMRVQAFIEKRLGEADLSPSAIAAAHHISLRHLHRLFQPEGVTVGGWIRLRRLERCRRDLADPLTNDLPVRTVASRWGFTSDSHFSRAFRAAYGASPAAYRRHLQELRGTADASEEGVPPVDVHPEGSGPWGRHG
ncbi:helix-turn-helix domain-containing protein [Streptosporangium sp. NPDC002524]|uniref:AraC-like ligand-binding domain-containing protein n=1 Tax=Streptosporangium sp. NPDC002524 TaxID=3154537 RepID=UPI0033304137